jgi:VWFA-related protein
MLTGRLAAAAVAAALAVAPAAAQRKDASSPSLDLVVLDVVVTDRDDRSVRDLTAAEFTIKEDGDVVQVKTFEHIDLRSAAPAGEGRTVAMLLDDVGVPPLGTTAIQQLSKAVLSLARPGDELSVVRLHSRNDEAFGDTIEAMARIEAYRGGIMPFNFVDAETESLRRMAAMSRQLGITEGRRKALVCIGAQLVCDIPEPTRDARADLWDAWVDAVSAAAKANVAVYAIIPGRVRQRGGGVVDATGGLTYASFSDFREPIVTLWNDSSTHYLIGYWPGPRSRQIHSIDVRVDRAKVRIRARQRRGE